MVPKKGLEPPHPCEYVDLNHARLPIPPLRHGTHVQRLLAEQAATLSLANVVVGVKLTRRLSGRSVLRYAGVFTLRASMSAALATRVLRVSSFLASVIQRQYSLRWV